MDGWPNHTPGSPHGNVRSCAGHVVRPDTPCLITFPHQEPGVTALASSSATSPVSSVAPYPNYTGPGVTQPHTHPSGDGGPPCHGNPHRAAMRHFVLPLAVLGDPRAPGSIHPGPYPLDTNRLLCEPPDLTVGNPYYLCCLPPTPWPGVTASDLLLSNPTVGFPPLDLSSTRTEPTPSSPLRQRLRRVEVIQAVFPQTAERARR